MSATVKIHDIEELRRNVEAQLGQLRASLIGNLDIDINLYDLLMDLSDKIMNMLYCDGGEYCHVDNAIVKAYDLARDIERVGSIVHMPEYARVGSRVSKMILYYALDYEDVGGTDE